MLRTLTSVKSDVGRPICLINDAASIDKNILESAKKAQYSKKYNVFIQASKATVHLSFLLQFSICPT